MPRARSRPKIARDDRARRGPVVRRKRLLRVAIRSARRRCETSARRGSASISSREAGESSRSCTTSGRSRTMNASDRPSASAGSAAAASASASASRSRASCIELLCGSAPDTQSIGLRQSSSATLPCEPGLLDDADEHVLEREPGFSRAQRSSDAFAAQRRRQRPALRRRRRRMITCSRSPNSDTRQRSIVCFSRSAARCGSIDVQLQQVAALRGS